MADTAPGAAPRPTPTASQKAADAAATAAEEATEATKESTHRIRSRFAAVRNDEDAKRAGLVATGLLTGAAVVANPVTAAPIAAYFGTKAVVDTVQRRRHRSEDNPSS